MRQVEVTRAALSCAVDLHDDVFGFCAQSPVKSELYGVRGVLAERRGFEPRIGLTLYTLSRRAT
jgi:hypothetical protein